MDLVILQLNTLKTKVYVMQLGVRWSRTLLEVYWRAIISPELNGLTRKRGIARKVLSITLKITIEVVLICTSAPKIIKVYYLRLSQFKPKLESCSKGSFS